MKFEKFMKIENDYQTQHVSRWLNNFPALKNERFIISEKVDGANFCIKINQTDIKFQSRNMELDENSKFFGYQDVIKKYQSDINSIQNFLIQTNDTRTYYIYCELFGSSVLNRIKYHNDPKEKSIKIISIFYKKENDDELIQIAFNQAVAFLLFANVSELTFVPIYGNFSFDEAINFDINRNTLLLNTDEPNIIEGIVISLSNPEKYVVKHDDGSKSYFILKKKNESFLEKQINRDKINYDKKDFTKFLQEYINDNRLISAESKFGKFIESNQIGSFLKELNQDILQDLSESDFYNDLIDNEKQQLKKQLNQLNVKLLKEKL